MGGEREADLCHVQGNPFLGSSRVRLCSSSRDDCLGNTDGERRLISGRGRPHITSDIGDASAKHAIARDNSRNMTIPN